MTFEITYVLVCLALMVIALIYDRMRPGMILFSVVVLFFCAGILSPKEVLEGFSNKGMITVALLFLVSEGIRKSGVLERLIFAMLPKKTCTVASANLRILPVVASISAFLNNTPVVVIFAPIIKNWARKMHLSPEKFLRFLVLNSRQMPSLSMYNSKLSLNYYLYKLNRIFLGALLFH